MKPKYKITATDLTVHPVDKDPFCYDPNSSPTIVRLTGDKEGGYYFELIQSNVHLEVDPDELEQICNAAKQMLESVMYEI